MKRLDLYKTCERCGGELRRTRYGASLILETVRQFQKRRFHSWCRYPRQERQRRVRRCQHCGDILRRKRVQHAVHGAAWEGLKRFAGRKFCDRACFTLWNSAGRVSYAPPAEPGIYEGYGFGEAA